VQTRLKEQAVERLAVRSSSPSLLAGRIFDDRMNPMTPTHANKNGVRYRYYVSHALLQGRAREAGSVARISAPDVEALIVNRLRANNDTDDTASASLKRSPGRAPPDLTVTRLVRNLPTVWADQEKQLGFA
jgi:site-specific DNA recombinase